MNEEQMRKEFEEWFSSVGFSIESIKATKEQFDAFNSYSWQIWQASRQAMKPIKLPMWCMTSEGPSKYLLQYEVIEAIQQAGYKVAP